MNSDSPLPDSREIVSTRTFSHPRERVFDAFAQSEKLAQWWGPKGFRNTIRQFDFRAGGSWLYTMHGPDGTDYPNESEFIAIHRPEQIVMDHLRPMHYFRLTMKFEDLAGQTRLTWRMDFKPPVENEALREFLLKANQENFDRLEAVLSSKSPLT